MKIKIPIYVCLVLLIMPAANAYILKGEHVLQLMIEKNNFPKRFAVSQQISFLETDVAIDESEVAIDESDVAIDESDVAIDESEVSIETINTEYDQKVRYQIPGQFRSDIDTNDLRRIHVVSSDNVLTVIDDRIVADFESWMDHYKDIFFFRSRKQMVEKLESLGINFSVTSLGRYNGKIFFVLGAQYPDESVPQLWIEKDTFLPKRWILEVSDTLGVVEKKEIRYVDWKTHYKFRYPSRVDFFLGENLVQRISVSNIDVNPAYTDDLFDIDKMKSFYPTSNTEETEPVDQNDIDKQINEFNKIYEYRIYE